MSVVTVVVKQSCVFVPGGKVRGHTEGDVRSGSVKERESECVCVCERRTLID